VRVIITGRAAIQSLYRSAVRKSGQGFGERDRRRMRKSTTTKEVDEHNRPESKTAPKGAVLKQSAVLTD